VTRGPGDGEADVIVTAAVAPLNAEPRAASEQLSQALSGHPLAVRERRGDWLRVRGRDEYLGWIHRGYVEDAQSDRADAHDARRVSLGCVVREMDGCRRALPLGAYVSARATVEGGIALGRWELLSRFPRTREAVARTAVEFFEGTPYEWGGITPWGADCSGLVQTTFAMHGVPLPRDAWQQAELGSEAGPDPGELIGGDLLFFSDRDDGRITHVALALGQGRLVHQALARGGNAVERVDNREDDVVRSLMTRFRFARRFDLFS
jgi:hypothetical protein